MERSKHILFLCSRNRLRSPTAESIFSGIPGIEVESAGLSPDAEVPVTSELIEWADTILVMERIHLGRLQQKFGPWLKGKRTASLNIPDDYDYMDPALVTLLTVRCRPYFPVPA